MLGKELHNYLNGFAKYVIQQSRSNLTKQKKNVDKNLYNSLKSETNVSKNSLQLTFEMIDYGKFQDKGVSGVKKRYNTPFSYTNKMPPVKPLIEWVTKKRFQFRDKKTGKFMSYQSTGFLVAKGVFNNGIKPSLFFTKPFEKAFESMPDDVVKAYGLDVESFLKSSIKDKL